MLRGDEVELWAYYLWQEAQQDDGLANYYAAERQLNQGGPIIIDIGPEYQYCFFYPDSTEQRLAARVKHYVEKRLALRAYYLWLDAGKPLGAEYAFEANSQFFSGLPTLEQTCRRAYSLWQANGNDDHLANFYTAASQLRAELARKYYAD